MFVCNLLVEADQSKLLSKTRYSVSVYYNAFYVFKFIL